jgi:hypothetical protein
LAPVVDFVAQGAIDRVAKLLQEPDWLLIEDLADKLHEGVAAPDLVRAVTDTHYPPDLRHVLNAGWVARLTWPEAEPYEELQDKLANGAPLSRAVRAVCLAVLDGAVPVTGSSGLGPGPNPSLVAGAQ